MGILRYFIALWASKAVFVLLRFLKRNATMYPGFIALKICPDYLARTKKSPNVLCVTGTNGKTTTTNMVADILSQSGMKVVSNRYGSNINTGVATALTHSVNIFGKPKVDALVLEVDERFSRLIMPFIKPDYLIVTNLFRDSIKRNAHPEYIFSILDTYVPKETKLVLNADCLQSSQLLKDNPKIRKESFLLIAKREDAQEFLNKWIPAKYTEDEYLKFDAENNALVYVIYEGGLDGKKFAMGFNEQKIENAHNNGFDISLAMMFGAFSNTDYIDLIGEYVDKYNVKYINLKNNDIYEEDSPNANKNIEAMCNLIKEKNIPTIS